MNLEKLKLFRHYYVMVSDVLMRPPHDIHRRHATHGIPNIISMVSILIFFGSSFPTDCVLHLLHADHCHSAQSHHAVPVAVVLRGKRMRCGRETHTVLSRTSTASVEVSRTTDVSQSNPKSPEVAVFHKDVVGLLPVIVVVVVFINSLRLILVIYLYDLILGIDRYDFYF